MGEHLLCAKRMHSRRKSIPTNGINGTVHKKKRGIKRECGSSNKLKGEPKEDVRASVQDHVRSGPEI